MSPLIWRTDAARAAVDSSADPRVIRHQGLRARRMAQLCSTGIPGVGVLGGRSMMRTWGSLRPRLEVIDVTAGPSGRSGSSQTLSLGLAPRATNRGRVSHWLGWDSYRSIHLTPIILRRRSQLDRGQFGTLKSDEPLVRKSEQQGNPMAWPTGRTSCSRLPSWRVAQFDGLTHTYSGTPLSAVGLRSPTHLVPTVSSAGV